MVKLTELYKLNKVSLGSWNTFRIQTYPCQIKQAKPRTGHLRVAEKSDGQLLVLGVDDASLMVLRNMDGKAHLELSRVELLSKNQESTQR